MEETQPQLATTVTFALHDIFDKLVTIENGKVILKPASRDALGTGSVQNLVEKLIDGKILICTQPPFKGTETTKCGTIELAHDALLEKWPKLKEWVEQNRPYIQEVEELKHAARRWMKAPPRDRSSFLWRGVRLKKAKRLLKQYPSRFSATEVGDVTKFLTASVVRKWRDAVFKTVLGVVVSPLLIIPSLIYIKPSVFPRRTMPVGNFEENALGLYDVLGNVWEWTEDYETYEGSERKGRYYARGGSWDNYQKEYCSPDFKLPLDGTELPTVGFRVARDLAQGEMKQRTFQDCAHCPTMVLIRVGALAIGQYGVTAGEWNACVENNACERRDQEYPGNSRPVINVDISDARAYANWLSSTTMARYRLPTGEDWKEFAGYNREIGRGDANCVAYGVTWKQFFDWLGSGIER